MTVAFELDRSSPVPLYYQLAQAMEAAIRDGQLVPGDRFENELALAKRLALSRPTTRRAIQELVDMGLLVRKRGVGTQVVQSPVHRRVELTSLFDDLTRAGQEPTTKLLDYRTGPVGEDIAHELNLAEDREVVTIRRLRFANGEPLALDAQPSAGRARPRGGRTRNCWAVPVAACPRRAYPAGPSANWGPAGHPRGSATARREARRAAADDDPHRLRRLGAARWSTGCTAIGRRGTPSTPRSSTAEHLTARRTRSARSRVETRAAQRRK